MKDFRQLGEFPLGHAVIDIAYYRQADNPLLNIVPMQDANVVMAAVSS